MIKLYRIIPLFLVLRGVESILRTKVVNYTSKDIIAR